MDKLNQQEVVTRLLKYLQKEGVNLSPETVAKIFEAIEGIRSNYYNNITADLFYKELAMLMKK